MAKMKMKLKLLRLSIITRKEDFNKAIFTMFMIFGNIKASLYTFWTISIKVVLMDNSL